VIDAVYFLVRFSRSSSSEWTESNEWPEGKQAEAGFRNSNEKTAMHGQDIRLSMRIQ